MDDESIIKLFFERSEDAISELASKYGKLIRKITYNILDDTEDTGECVNDTYLSVWNSIPPERPRPLVSYVAKIARNTAINKFKKV